MSDVRIGLARETARSVLSRFRVTKPPTELEPITAHEQLTVKLMQSWPPSVSGLLLRDARLIGLNAQHNHKRRRFSLAHELGHWFMRHDFDWHEAEVTIDSPPSPASYGKDPTEGEADEFAGELLAPRSFLKEALRKTQDVSALAELFDISEEALWVRLLHHKLL